MSSNDRLQIDQRGARAHVDTNAIFESLRNFAGGLLQLSEILRLNGVPFRKQFAPSFLQMSEVVEKTMHKINNKVKPSLEDYFNYNTEARSVATSFI